MVCVVRERAVGSVRVERVVTEPETGPPRGRGWSRRPSTGRSRSTGCRRATSSPRGASVPVGAAPVVVVIPSDEPGGASVEAGPRVGIGQPSGWAPEPPREPVVGASGESAPPVPGARVDPVPVAVASPGRSAVGGAADEDGGSELLGPSIGIGQPSGATAGTATAGVCAALGTGPVALLGTSAPGVGLRRRLDLRHVDLRRPLRGGPGRVGPLRGLLLRRVRLRGSRASGRRPSSVVRRPPRPGHAWARDPRAPGPGRPAPAAGRRPAGRRAPVRPASTRLPAGRSARAAPRARRRETAPREATRRRARSAPTGAPTPTACSTQAPGRSRAGGRRAAGWGSTAGRGRRPSPARLPGRTGRRRARRRRARGRARSRGGRRARSSRRPGQCPCRGRSPSRRRTPSPGPPHRGPPGRPRCRSRARARSPPSRRLSLGPTGAITVRPTPSAAARIATAKRPVTAVLRADQRGHLRRRRSVPHPFREPEGIPVPLSPRPATPGPPSRRSERLRVRCVGSQPFRVSRGADGARWEPWVQSAAVPTHERVVEPTSRWSDRVMVSPRLELDLAVVARAHSRVP